MILKILKWDKEKFTWIELSVYSQAIHNLVAGSSFWEFIDKTLNATCCLYLINKNFTLGTNRNIGRNISEL